MLKVRKSFIILARSDETEKSYLYKVQLQENLNNAAKFHSMKKLRQIEITFN